jgi:hypothetical protein
MQICVVGLGRMGVVEQVLSAMRFGFGSHAKPGKK